MKNHINFAVRPEALFLNPARDQGLAFLSPPDFFWRPRPRAVIQGHSASSHESMDTHIKGFLASTEKHRAFSHAIEVNTVPVLLQDAGFARSYVSSKGKFLLSGASGMRLLNTFVWENEKENPEAALISYFDACQNDSAYAFPLADNPPSADCVFAVECRNTFNYYHFVTESLAQLCLVADSGATGPIYLHYPNSEDKTRAFTRAFVDVLFPELAHRVQFKRTPTTYGEAIVPYNLLLSYYQAPTAQVPSLDSYAPDHYYWADRKATRASQGLLAMNSVDSSLYKLRDRALRAIEGKDFSHLPRRFWVGRAQGSSRSRKMDGEDEIIEMLSLFGFETIAFETLSPLEQIALVANAEMMVSYHGAGFTNMLFANPEAYVIELGTAQTGHTRWGDFWRLANASGCRYVSFFADYNKDDPLTHPDFAEHGLVPVRLSQQGLAQVMSFIVTVLGQVPRLQRAEDVMRLGQQLMGVGAYQNAAALYVTHQGMEEGDIGLSLSMADCHEKLGNHAEQLAALYTAYRADPSRWATLIQVIWCARKMNDLETVRAGLAVLGEAFPDRLSAFVKDRPWFQKLL